jgi:Family of unknown function (DUF5677)
MTTPHKMTIDRDKASSDVAAHFSKQIWLLADLVNYGSHLIPRCYESSTKTPVDAFILVGLTKQALTHLDGCEVLIAQGAILASHVSARALFEACLYVEWVLQADTEQRARQYYVWNLRQSRLWASRFIAGSAEHNDLEMSFKSSTDLPPITSLASIQRMEPEAQKQLAAIDQLLATATYKGINDEFNRLKRKYDRPWYAPFKGPGSIRQMVRDLNRLGEYDIFYSRLSDVTHSTDVRKHFSVAGTQLTFEPIRQLESIDTVMRFVISKVLHLYRAVLDRYRPDEGTNFDRKYTTEWRDAFLSIPSVKYKVETHSAP